MDVKGRMMLVANPASGRRNTEKVLAAVCSEYLKYGWTVTVFLTQKSGDAQEYVAQFGADFDRITAMGGDGTLSQVMEGVVLSGIDTEVCYIPSGSTNDYATSHGIPTDYSEAVRLSCNGVSTEVDVARFNESIVAFHGACGPFAGVVNNTSQDTKNQMGYLAYILDGAKDVSTFRPEHVRITLDDEVIEGDYIYGGLISTPCLGGGIFRFPLDEDCYSDGKFELFLLKCPRDLIEIGEAISELGENAFNKEYTVLKSVERCSMDFSDTLAWSLDGEPYPPCTHLDFEVLRKRIRLVKRYS